MVTNCYCLLSVHKLHKQFVTVCFVPIHLKGRAFANVDDLTKTIFKHDKLVNLKHLF